MTFDFDFDLACSADINNTSITSLNQADQIELQLEPQLDNSHNTESTVTLYLNTDDSGVSEETERNPDPLSDTLPIAESEPTDQREPVDINRVFHCSLCRSVSDYRQPSYICVDCLYGYSTITRICHCCIVVETIYGRTAAHPEWNTNGTVDVIIHHYHRPPSSGEAYEHSLQFVPAEQS